MKSLDQLVDKTRAALGDDVVAIVLYGSAAAGDHHEKFSDFNVLCVLRSIGTSQLRSAESVFRWWREQGNPAPLMLTEHELETSTDCFPIEFSDIRQSNRVLFGKDVVSGLEIDRTFYRAQVEHELRAKLLRIRQKASGILSDKDALRRLLADSVSTFCVLIRHALTLATGTAPFRKREIVEAGSSQLGFDAAPFRSLLDLREGRAKERDIEPETLLAAYMKEIEKIVDVVDRMPKE